jgi:hypothetical protein
MYRGKPLPSAPPKKHGVSDAINQAYKQEKAAWDNWAVNQAKPLECAAGRPFCSPAFLYAVAAAFGGQVRAVSDTLIPSDLTATVSCHDS